MRVDLHGEVGRQLQAGVLGEDREPAELRDPADARGVGLDDVAGAQLDEPLVLGDGGEHLAGGDGRGDLADELGVARVVVGVQRLLDPHEVELLHGPAHAHGGRTVPLLVGVDHEREVLAEVLAHGGQALEVDLVIGVAHLDLDAPDAGLDRPGGVVQDLGQRGAEEAAGGVVAPDGVAVGADQLGQRQPGALGLQVPQRDVDGRDRLDRNAGAADGGARPQQLDAQAVDVAGVLTDEVVGDLSGVRELGGTARALGIAEADAGAALDGLQLAEEEMDLGHGLLATGEDLGVGDLVLEREHDVRQRDARDPV